MREEPRGAAANMGCGSSTEEKKEETPTTQPVVKEPSQAENDAAIKIQAMQKGKAARREVDKMKADKKKDEEEKKSEEDKPGAPAVPQLTPEEEEKIAKIQAVARGNTDRKKVEEMKEAKKAADGTGETGDEENTDLVVERMVTGVLDSAVEEVERKESEKKAAESSS